MDFDALYPNRFMKAGEFAGKPYTLTISDVKVEELEGDKGKKVKGIVSFKETTKQLVLNRTNGECLKAMFGRETNNWVGKRVTFFPKTITDSFTDELIPAIRVLGSPDIEADKSFTAKIGRKQVSMKLQKVAPKKALVTTAPQVATATAPRMEATPAELSEHAGPVDADEAAEIAAAENAQAAGGAL